MPSRKYRRRLEVPKYLYEQLQQIAVRESRTVASVAGELLLTALQDYRPSWCPRDHLPLLNDRARHVLELATDEAHGFGHNYVGTEHLLLGLLVEEEGAASRYLVDRGVELDDVRRTIERHIGRGETAASQELELVPRARRALALAVDEVRRLGHGRVGTEHILLGLAREGQGVAAGILDRVGIDIEQLRQRKLTALSQLD
jgi:ATP-dependent Clp protease ATP-binding subunit ClpC